MPNRWFIMQLMQAIGLPIERLEQSPAPDSKWGDYYCFREYIGEYKITGYCFSGSPIKPFISIYDKDGECLLEISASDLELVVRAVNEVLGR